MGSTSETIKKAINQQMKDATAEEKEEFAKVFRDILEKKKSPLEAMGISQKVVDSLYAAAYTLFQSGKYEDAGDMFRLLVTFDMTDPRYALGAGACYQKLENWERAAHFYLTSSSADPRDPMTFYHAAECYLAMENLGYAHANLAWALDACGDKKEFESLKDRIEMMQEGIVAKLVEHYRGTTIKLSKVEMKHSFD